MADEFYFVVCRFDGSRYPFEVVRAEDDNHACTLLAGVSRGNEHHNCRAVGQFASQKEADIECGKLNKGEIPCP